MQVFLAAVPANDVEVLMQRVGNVLDVTDAPMFEQDFDITLSWNEVMVFDGLFTGTLAPAVVALRNQMNADGVDITGMTGDQFIQPHILNLVLQAMIRRQMDPTRGVSYLMQDVLVHEMEILAFAGRLDPAYLMQTDFEGWTMERFWTFMVDDVCIRDFALIRYP